MIAASTNASPRIARDQLEQLEQQEHAEQCRLDPEHQHAGPQGHRSVVGGVATLGVHRGNAIVVTHGAQSTGR
jgi:hypothetical protein